MRPRPAASGPESHRPGHIGGARWLLFGALLVTPNLALQQLGPQREWWVLHAWWMAISIFTYLAYAADKRRARSAADRIPEATLHLLSLLGGWPGALLAQGRHRHKTAKVAFQFGFWMTVAAHQALAIDYLLGWPLRSAIAASFK